MTSADGVIATIGPVTESNSDSRDSEETSLASLQRSDAELKPLVEYLETGTLPEGDKEARKMALSSTQYTFEDDILYHVEDDGTLRLVPPQCMRESIFTEAHGGTFGAYLGDAKVYSELRRHYWWVLFKNRRFALTII